MKTQYTLWREAVALLTPEQRFMLAHACVAEFAAENQGTPAMYAWNRVSRSLHAANDLTPETPPPDGLTIEFIDPQE